MDKHKNFDALRKYESGAAFDIAYEDRRSDFLIFSPHAGGIEQGTSEICLQIAGNTFSYYLFAGNGTNCKSLHITSINFDETIITGLLCKHNHAISIHGMTNEQKMEVGADIYLGGLNMALIEITTKTLRDCLFITTNNIEIPLSGLSGKDHRNVTNKCSGGKGMQVEISEDLRSKFFKGDYKKKTGRKETTEAFKNFCDGINHSIVIFREQEARKGY